MSDHDLMAYFDDELEDGELEDVEALLAEQEDARDKIAGLGLVSDLICDQVDGDDRADGIADAVMAKLEAEVDEAEVDEAEVDEAEADEAEADEAEVDDTRDDKVSDGKGALIELPAQRSVAVAPANDNSRTIWSLAAAAAAVAAGMFLWGNGARDAEPVALTPSKPALEAPAESVEPAPETLGEVAVAPQEGSSAEEDEDAVEIAQLDFGDDDDRTGSIFKVDDKMAGVHTAVVWVSEFGADE